MSNEESEPEFGGSTRMFQISEPDLETLEHDLPDLMAEMGLALNHSRNRVRWRRVIEVIRNIRWNYGPPEGIEIIPAD